MRGKFRVGLLAAVLGLAACGSAERGDGPWTQLEPGLEAVRFDTRSLKVGGEQDLTVLRVDPALWGLRLLTVERPGTGEPRTVEDWCADFGLVAAVNAGMFQADGRTHVGFCQADGVVLNPSANGYLSAAGLDPADPGRPSFRIFDLDQTPLADVAGQYRTVVQNLRLIKRGGENRWDPQGERWPEAALGEDSRGRALLIHCATPYTMHELNRILLRLPLDLVCAQHLEGNTPARLWVAHPAWPPAVQQQTPAGPALPFVFGVARR